MTKLLEIVLLNIQRVLPKTFGLIFDGNLNVYYWEWTRSEKANHTAHRKESICSKYPVVQRHLSAAADIIHEPQFESAVAKIQGNDFVLTQAEKRRVSFFLIDSAVAGEDAEDEDEDDGDLNSTMR